MWKPCVRGASWTYVAIVLGAGAGCGSSSRANAPPSAFDGASPADAASMECGDGGCGGSRVLASGQSNPRSIAVDDANVYWLADGPGFTEAGFDEEIVACAKRGCRNAPTVLAHGAWGNVFNLVVHGGSLYWGGSEGLYRCSTTGCGAEPSAIDFPVPNFSDVAVDSTGNVYFVDAVGGGTVSQCGTVGCSQDASFSWIPEAGLLPDGDRTGWHFTPIDVATDSQDLYVLAAAAPVTVPIMPVPTNLMVVSCSLAACTSTARALSLADGVAPATQFGTAIFALDVGAAYVMTGDGTDGTGAVERTPKESGEPATGGPPLPTTLVVQLGALSAIASDGQTLYVAEFAEPNATGGWAPNSGRITRCPVSGCGQNAQSFRDYVDFPTSLAIDDTTVYWTEADMDTSGTAPTGRVMMQAK